MGKLGGLPIGWMVLEQGEGSDTERVRRGVKKTYAENLSKGG